MKTRPWNTSEMLDSPEVIGAYLELSIKEDSPEELLRSLNTVARSKGMTTIAEKTGLDRQNLYRTLAPDSNPTLGTVLKIIGACGLQLSVVGAGTSYGDCTLSVTLADGRKVDISISESLADGPVGHRTPDGNIEETSQLIPILKEIITSIKKDRAA